VLRLPDPPLWFPHTHGDPALVPVTARRDGAAIPLGTVGFRRVERLPGEGFALAVNGVPVFCRGAVWTGAGAPDPLAAAGMNMVRVPGWTRYPEAAFLAACDRLGLLVWQDFMFARFDYPADETFLAECRAEAEAFLDRTAAHPSLVALCGGDEVQQAAAMAGQAPAAWAHPLFDSVLPAAVASLRPDAVYVPHAPGGAVPPFAKTAPVAHYFGVGAYQRPLEDASGVRFAAACLAFSNPPVPAACRALCTVPGDAAWTAALPRDPAAPWSFEDARDFYLRTLFGLDPAWLRRTDPERWLAAGRAAVALAMQSAFAAWRADPGCGGALVLAMQDAVPGPGWGLLGHDGRPKSAWFALASLCRPVQVLLRDGGMDGVTLHLGNEGGAARAVRLELRGLAPDGGVATLAAQDLTLPPRSRRTMPATEAMDGFRDLTGAWGFGPAPFPVLAARLLEGGAVLSESTIFPGGPALPRQALGLRARLDGDVLTLGTDRFAQFVAIDDEAATPSDDHFHLWPGEARSVRLSTLPARGTVAALNGFDTVHYR
jgi:beta-mannosidase